MSPSHCTPGREENSLDVSSQTGGPEFLAFQEVETMSVELLPADEADDEGAGGDGPLLSYTGRGVPTDRA